MSIDSLLLVHRYLDSDLNDEELQRLESALTSSSELRKAFVQVALIHEKLSQELAPTAFGSSLPELNREESEAKGSQRLRRYGQWRSAIVFLATSVLLMVGLFMVFNRNQLSASQEITRLIQSLSSGDKLYSIDVEQIALPSQKQLDRYDSSRPPKPSLEGAKLFLRGADQFVLKRYLGDDSVFITGSDGQISWAIAPDGPIRISKDVHEFNRDLPGHEHSIPLANLTQGLTQVQKAYAIQMVPVSSSGQLEDQESMLIATKKRGQRGPKRIEMQYEVETGRIVQIRFIEMPYGPERLTVRLTLIDENDLPLDFFRYSYHQTKDRAEVLSLEE
jgi:tellurite resistance protein